MSIFPSSITEIDRSIISFSDNESLVNLSGVNKHANEIISNIFFKMLFNCQHPALANINFELKNLCVYFPDNCWKITCCAFSNGELHLSQTFISEYSPNIYKCVKSEKAQVEIELTKICGSGYRDEKSPIHIAWEASETIKRLANEYEQLRSSLRLEVDQLLRQLVENCPEIERDVIRDTAGIFAFALQHYTDEQILNPNDQETIAIHDEPFYYARKIIPSQIASDESLRRDVDTMISTRLPDLNAILTSNPGSNNSHLIRCLAKKLIEIQFLAQNKGFEYYEEYKFRNNYRDLEQKRVDCVNRLQEIERRLAEFDPSGKITLLPHTFLQLGVSGEVYCRTDYKINESYFGLLQTEFDRAQRGEIAIMRIPPLEKCLELIGKLIDHPEATSPDALASIRQMINSLSNDDIGQIWGTLYHKCANGIKELQWSEKHFHEFLPDLMETVASQYNSYCFYRDLLNNYIEK